jgi:glycosyltransferase involved in cell wall biosynthesis
MSQLQVVEAGPAFHARVIALRPRPAVDVVVPVHNREGALRLAVTRVQARLARHFPFSARITIADCASTDRTAEVAAALAAELGEVRVLRLNETGRGRALAAGWLTSEARVVTSFDLDEPADLSALISLIAPVISGHSHLALRRGGRLTALRADIARSLLPQVVSRNWLFDTELLLRAQRARLRIHEIGT